MPEKASYAGQIAVVIIGNAGNAGHEESLEVHNTTGSGLYTIPAAAYASAAAMLQMQGQHPHQPVAGQCAAHGQQLQLPRQQMKVIA